MSFGGGPARPMKLSEVTCEIWSLKSCIPKGLVSMLMCNVLHLQILRSEESLTLNIVFLVLDIIGPLHDLVTWYKITHAGDQVAQWDFQNKATFTSPP